MVKVMTQLDSKLIVFDSDWSC